MNGTATPGAVTGLGAVLVALATIAVSVVSVLLVPATDPEAQRRALAGRVVPVEGPWLATPVDDRRDTARAQTWTVQTDCDGDGCELTLTRDFGSGPASARAETAAGGWLVAVETTHGHCRGRSHVRLEVDGSGRRLRALEERSDVPAPGCADRPPHVVEWRARALGSGLTAAAGS